MLPVLCNRLSIVRVFRTVERLIAHLVDVHAAALKWCRRRCSIVRRLIFLPLFEDVGTPEVDVSWSEVVQALVIAAVTAINQLWQTDITFSMVRNDKS